jgi:hypothetical protein
MRKILILTACMLATSVMAHNGHKSEHDRENPGWKVITLEQMKAEDKKIYGTENPRLVQRSPSYEGLDRDNYYTNSDGNIVHGPANRIDGTVPPGASAQCRDGTYSFSQHYNGTCSYHGGVRVWLHRPSSQYNTTTSRASSTIYQWIPSYDPCVGQRTDILRPLGC